MRAKSSETRVQGVVFWCGDGDARRLRQSLHRPTARLGAKPARATGASPRQDRGGTVVGTRGVTTDSLKWPRAAANMEGKG